MWSSIPARNLLCRVAVEMLFTTIEYFVFVAAVLLLYRVLPHRQQNVLLLVGSYVFYGWWDWRFLGLIATSTAVDFAMGRAIEHAHAAGDTAAARRRLLVSIGVNLSILGFFKYFNFFVDSAEGLLQGLGYSGPTWTLHIILPVGISFYTFQTMSYTIDVYRRRIPAARSPIDYALFVSFFPQLIAGPIERASTLLPQIQHPRRVTRTDWEQGLLLFGLGFFRKIAIADPAGLLADTYFANPAAYPTIPLAAGVGLYALQIYNDFAGYSDMARGTARVLGFTLMRNFRHPYFATSFSDFWRRWHISLSAWLRDYLYISLGGSRRGRLRTHANLMATMLLGGLWHGAAWTFVAWGALHGTCLILQHAWTGMAPRLASVCISLPPFSRRAAVLPQAPAAGGALRFAVRRGAAALSVFAAVTLAWVFFRAPDFATAGAYLQGLVRLNPGGEGALVPLAALAVFTLAIDLPQALADDEFVFLNWPVPRLAAATAAAGVVLLSSGSSHAPFIYFQF